MMKRYSLWIPFLAAVSIAPQVAAHTLGDAIQKALDSNPEVLSAKAALGVAEEQLISAKAGYLPTVDLSMQAGEENMRKPASAKTEMWQQDHNITLKQNLFDGGATDSAVERSEQMFSNAKTRVGDLTGTITLNVIESWYELYRLQKVVQMTQKNVAQHKKVFEQIQQKVKAGAAGKAELTAAETPYILALTAQAANRGQLSDAMARYSKVVGETPEGVLPNPEPLLENATLPESVDATVEQVLATAPAIRTAEANLLAAEADARGAKAGLLPTVDFEFKELIKNDAAGTDGTEYGWTAFLKLNYNLYKGGADQARERETAKALVDSREQLNLARRTAEEQARINWSALQVSAQILRLNQQQMKSATETRNSTNEQFKLGEADIMAIMGAEDALFQAQQSVLQERITGTVARYRLLNQLGTLSAHYLGEAPESVESEESGVTTEDQTNAVIDRVAEQSDVAVGAISDALKSAVEEVGETLHEGQKAMADLVDEVTPEQQSQSDEVVSPEGQSHDAISSTPGQVLETSAVSEQVTSALPQGWGKAYEQMRAAGWVQ